MKSGESAGSLEAISHIGHEMRTPLTLIRGAATLLVSSYEQLPPERARQMLHLIELGVETLIDQVEDLITAYHLEAGELKVHLERAELAGIVDPVVEALGRREERTIRVAAERPGLHVQADRERAAQVFRVLLSNALRYSPLDQPVEVGVSPRGRQVVIEVCDRGPGIPAGDRKHVFERFRRLGHGGGAGLGLYLARGLARAMGGDVAHRPRPDGGSVFSFTLNG